MKIKDKVKTVRFKLFTVICISTMIVIFVIVLINNILLESFYIYSKTEVAKKISEEVNNYYKSGTYYNISTILRQIEIKNNIDILILDKYDEVEYCSNKEMIEITATTNNSKALHTIYSNKRTTINRVNDNNNVYMLLTSYLDNDYIIYIRIPITPIKESVRISNETLLLIGIIMILISGIISSYIARRFTAPIVKLNKITKKMAKLDFSEKYEENDTDDEINTLGKNINEMSDKLETTINQLRNNNSELEKDIEEKLKIDDKRKRFISDVSHELKTPISLIQGYAEGLLENVNSDEESRKFYAEVIIEESEKMNKLVQDLLKLMKLEYQEEKPKDEEFNLTELIKEELRKQSKIIEEKNINIEFDENKEIKVYASQEALEQVVRNYLTNAIKHCEEKKKEKKIVIRTEKIEDKIRLYVYNTGEKIAEKDIDKIWDRFYKADESRNREDGGTGIGLAIVKAIMNNYKNDFGVKNFENGVEFYCDISTIGTGLLVDQGDTP